MSLVGSTNGDRMIVETTLHRAARRIYFHSVFVTLLTAATAFSNASPIGHEKSPVRDLAGGSQVSDVDRVAVHQTAARSNWDISARSQPEAASVLASVSVGEERDTPAADVEAVSDAKTPNDAATAADTKAAADTQAAADTKTAADTETASETKPPSLAATSPEIAAPAGTAPADISVKPVETEAAPAARPLEVRRLAEVDDYLWSVYQRSAAKQDSHGDFTRKDGIAAARLGLSVQDYVVGGMDPDFREQLFHLGHALDAAGMNWTILSAFRDDFRQNLAVGLKAHGGNSFHGGTAATGGYGHGCAVDLAGTDSADNGTVWNWLDQHLEPFGLYRPLRGIDPAHVLVHGAWHDVGKKLRSQRIGGNADPSAGGSNDPGRMTVGGHDDAYGDTELSEEQYNCVRPRLVADATNQKMKLAGHFWPVTGSHQAHAETAQSRADIKHGKVNWKTAGSTVLRRSNLRHAPPPRTNHPV